MMRLYTDCCGHPHKDLFLSTNSNLFNELLKWGLSLTDWQGGPPPRRPGGIERGCWEIMQAMFDIKHLTTNVQTLKSYQ